MNKPIPPDMLVLHGTHYAPIPADLMANQQPILRLSLRMLGTCMSKDTSFSIKDWWMRITGVYQAAIWTGSLHPDLDEIGEVVYNLYREFE